MRRLLSLLPLVAIACGGTGGDRIATRTEPAGDLYVHSPGAPRIRLAETEREALALPALPDNASLWTAELPVGSEGTARPSVLVASDAEGAPIEMKFWIATGGSRDFAAGEAWAIEQYEDYEGWYQSVEPIRLPFAIDGEAGSEAVEASYRVLVNVYPGGAGFRLYPAETKVGAFPGDGTAFLLYDGDRNGIYDAADRLVIDVNGDGTFDGNRNSVELYAMDEPFLLADGSYVIGSIAPDGSSVALARSAVAAEVRDPFLPGDPAPDFTLTSIDGETLRFSEETAGRPVMLAYWATW
jgi:hypothetical protein